MLLEFRAFYRRQCLSLCSEFVNFNVVVQREVVERRLIYPYSFVMHFYREMS